MKKLQTNEREIFVVNCVLFGWWENEKLAEKNRKPAAAPAPAAAAAL